MRPPLPSFSTTSAGMLPKLPPGRTRLACSTRSLVGSRTVWALIVQFPGDAVTRSCMRQAKGVLDPVQYFLIRSLDRHEDRMAHLVVNRLGDMTLARRVLDQQHFARADDARLAVARLDADAAVEVDDVLTARRGMPFIVIGAGRLAEDDAGRGEGRRGLAAAALVFPFDLDVAEMRLALVVDIEIVDA